MRKQEYLERKLELDHFNKKRRHEQQEARKLEQLNKKRLEEQEARNDSPEKDQEKDLQDEKDFLEKMKAGNLAPAAAEELQEIGLGAEEAGLGAGRRPGRWEDTASWIFSFPANTLPRSALNDDGTIDKVKMLMQWLGCMKAVNDSLCPQNRINLNKLAALCCVELPLTSKEVRTADPGLKLSEHVHISAKYLGRACRTSHLWQDAFQAMGLIVDVKTFEDVIR